MRAALDCATHLNVHAYASRDENEHEVTDLTPGQFLRSQTRVRGEQRQQLVHRVPLANAGRDCCERAGLTLLGQGAGAGRVLGVVQLVSPRLGSFTLPLTPTVCR
jgi:hypothetical protein